jgi:hypothetical protein
MVDFPWIGFYSELADKLLGYKNNRKDLILSSRTYSMHTGYSTPAAL